jgi:hypothetical protein
MHFEVTDDAERDTLGMIELRKALFPTEAN